MKLQHATRYAIWSIIELASREGEQVSANEIAEKYGISQHHLAKVLRTLARARVVASVRGPGGGFVFTGRANRLTLADIITLFESDWHDSEPLASAAETPIAAEIGRVLNEIDRITAATLRSVTVQTIINNARRTARLREAAKDIAAAPQLRSIPR
ncbi:MAG: Rrf2 family transcriptional regulator [Hyphomicrobiaceae bacterium]